MSQPLMPVLTLLMLGWISLAAPTQSFAQRKKKKDELAAASPVTPAPAPLTTAELNRLPLFGNRPRTPDQQRTDQAFLTGCDGSFASRREASKFFEARAWTYLQESQLDTAAYRFNLAWLLDATNANAYWGLGSVSANRGRVSEALGLLNRALTLDSANAALLTDASSLYLERFKTSADKTDLSASQQLANQAVRHDPAHAPAYSNLARAAFYQENYDQAWTYFHKARELSLSSIDLALVTDLLAKKPDPLGFFK